MSEEGFFKRWSRLKATGGDAEAPTALAPAPAPVPPPPATAQPIAPAPSADAPPAARTGPTLDDVARLTPESDFSAFVGQGVDKSVQRLALKKLFADPHFKVMDGLDMYMDDYNKPSPVSAAMLAALDHARGALRLPPRVEAEQAGDGAVAPDAGVAAPAAGTGAATVAAAASDAAGGAPRLVPDAERAAEHVGMAHAGNDAIAGTLPGSVPCTLSTEPPACAPHAKGTAEPTVDAYTDVEDSAAGAAAIGAAMPARSHPQSLQGPA